MAQIAFEIAKAALEKANRQQMENQNAHVGKA